MQQGVQTDAMCNIHIQQYSELLANTCCIRLQGGFTAIDSLIFAFIASGIFKKKKTERKKKSYIILLV